MPWPPRSRAAPGSSPASTTAATRSTSAGLRAARGGSDAVLLEDAAHSIGGTLDGIPVGSLADVTTFSFFPTKNLTTAEGGAVVAPTPRCSPGRPPSATSAWSRTPTGCGPPTRGPWFYEVHEAGVNYRLPDVLAALGSSQLARLDGFARRRREIHARYTEGLRDLDALMLPPTRAGAVPTWHLYSLRIRDGRRRALFDHLRTNGIGVQVNYIPVYWHPLYADLGYRRGMCPVAEEYYEQEISLPAVPRPRRQRRRPGHRPRPRVRGWLTRSTRVARPRSSPAGTAPRPARPSWAGACCTRSARPRRCSATRSSRRSSPGCSGRTTTASSPPRSSSSRSA